MSGVNSKYTIPNLPNSFTVFGNNVTDNTTKLLAHQISVQYNAKGAIGMKKQVNKIRRAIISNPSFWANTVGKDRMAILDLWERTNWGELTVAARTSLFAVTDVL